MAEQICLKYSNYISNFKGLWEEEALFDVTLASDGQCIGAHKLILSACSPFFKKIIQLNPCQHPVIILQDIRFLEVGSLLSFIYNGEVKIQSDNLPALLQAAETLQIRGLNGASEQLKEKMPFFKSKLSRKSQEVGLQSAKRHRGLVSCQLPPPSTIPSADIPIPCLEHTYAVAGPSQLSKAIPSITSPIYREPSRVVNSTGRLGECYEPMKLIAEHMDMKVEQVVELDMQEDPLLEEIASQEDQLLEEICIQEEEEETDFQEDPSEETVFQDDPLEETSFQEDPLLNVPADSFYTGASYPNWQAVQAAFNQWADSGHHPMSTRASYVNPKPSPEYPYQKIIYTCKHYGTMRPRGKNLRTNQHHNAQGCPVRVKVTLLSTSQTYIVRQLTSKHNHPVSAELRAHYPDRRIPKGEEVDAISKMIRTNMKIADIKNIVRNSMGKSLSSKDLRNLKARVQSESASARKRRVVKVQPCEHFYGV